MNAPHLDSTPIREDESFHSYPYRTYGSIALDLWLVCIGVVIGRV